MNKCNHYASLQVLILFFYGCKLLTAENPETDKDIQLFNKLGINTETIIDDSQQQDKILKTALVNEQHKELFYEATN